MSEMNEAVSEPTGLSKREHPDVSDEFYVPDYVMRDFGEPEETLYSSARAFGRHSRAEFLL